VSGIALLPG